MGVEKVSQCAWETFSVGMGNLYSWVGRHGPVGSGNVFTQNVGIVISYQWQGKHLPTEFGKVIH